MSSTIQLAILVASINSAITCSSFFKLDSDSPKVSNDARPNIIIMLADDMGWGDLGANWNPKGMVSDTPNMDKLAACGIRFTDFHAGASLCSPSRAALLTGRLGKRTGVITNFGQGSIAGLPLNETTFIETFKAAGYRTGMFGKWHLGVNGPYHPINRGLDFYFGLPYSNDMGCMDNPGYNLPACQACPRDNSTMGDEAFFASGTKQVTSCDMSLAMPLYNNTAIIEQPVNATLLTQRYVQHATSFIKKSVADKQPFILYAAFTHMHVPHVYDTTTFGNKSRSRGIYGDVLREMDQAVSDIVTTVEDAGVDKNTLIWFSSDNGPWLSKCDYGGSIGPYLGEWQTEQGGRGSTGKLTVWEAGHRVPSFAYWPSRIKPGQVDDSILSALDIYPTIATIAGLELPQNRKYDGVDISDVLFDGGNIVDRNIFHPNSGAFGSYGEFDGVRVDNYKAIYKSGNKGFCNDCEGNPGYSQSHYPPLIFDLNSDIAEQTPLDNSSASYNQVLATLAMVLSDLDEDIKNDNTTVVDYSGKVEASPCCNRSHVVCRCNN